jgi:uroporphyrinogen-III decarboxylase
LLITRHVTTQVFESWAGELTPDAFDEFLLPELTRIANEVKEGCRAAGIAEVPMVIFAKGAHYALEGLAATAYDVIQVRGDCTRRKMTLNFFLPWTNNTTFNILCSDLSTL